MDLLFELLLDLIIDGSIEMSKSKKVPNIIRYPLIAIIILLFLIVIFSLMILGIKIINKEFLSGLFIIVVGIVLLILSIINFKKIYLEKKNK